MRLFIRILIKRIRSITILEFIYGRRYLFKADVNAFLCLEIRINMRGNYGLEYKRSNHIEERRISHNLKHKEIIKTFTAKLSFKDFQDKDKDNQE